MGGRGTQCTVHNDCLRSAMANHRTGKRKSGKKTKSNSAIKKKPTKNLSTKKKLNNMRKPPSKKADTPTKPILPVLKGKGNAQILFPDGKSEANFIGIDANEAA